jgi:hypothetical protein
LARLEGYAPTQAQLKPWQAPGDTVDGCEILQQLIGGQHPIGCQPSFRWCRISLAHPQCEA